MKNFIYYFSGRDEIKGKPPGNISLKNLTVKHTSKDQIIDNILNLKYDNVRVNGVTVPKPAITGLVMLHTD